MTNALSVYIILYMTTSVSKDLWNAEDMIKEGIKGIRKESEIPCVCVCVCMYHIIYFPSINLYRIT